MNKEVQDIINMIEKWEPETRRSFLISLEKLAIIDEEEPGNAEKLVIQLENYINSLKMQPSDSTNK